MSPIVIDDIEYRLSGGAANTDPDASLGGAMSTDPGGVIPSNIPNRLIDDVGSSEATAGDVEYRGFYVKNDHGTITWENVTVWIDELTVSGDTEFDIALADEAVNVAMETIPNEQTAPTGPVFSRPISKAAGLVIGNIPPGQFKGIWLRRTVDAGAAGMNDFGSVRCEGDTAT